MFNVAFSKTLDDSRPYGQNPPVRHRLHGIGDQVPQHLFQVRRIRFKPGQILGKFGAKLDIFRQPLFRKTCCHEILHLERCCPGRPGTDRIKEITQDFFCIVNFLCDYIQVFPNRFFSVSQLHLQEKDRVAHHSQGVAQFVPNSPRKKADHGQFFGLSLYFIELPCSQEHLYPGQNLHTVERLDEKLIGSLLDPADAVSL